MSLSAFNFKFKRWRKRNSYNVDQVVDFVIFQHDLILLGIYICKLESICAPLLLHISIFSPDTGEFVGLTGARWNGSEMLACGLATHFVLQWYYALQIDDMPALSYYILCLLNAVYVISSSMKLCSLGHF